MTKTRWITIGAAIWLFILTGSYLNNAVYGQGSSIKWNHADDYLLIAIPLVIVLLRYRVLAFHQRAQSIRAYRWIFLHIGSILIGLLALTSSFIGLIFNTKRMQVTSNPTNQSQDQRDPLGNDPQNPNFW